MYRAKDHTIAIKLATGVELAISIKLLQGLENADPAEIAKVEILGLVTVYIGDRSTTTITFQA